MRVPRPGRFPGFLLVSGLLIAGTATASGLIVGAFFEQHIRDHEQTQLAEVVQSQAQQHLVAGVFAASSDPAHAQMFRMAFEGLPGVFRVKVFEPSGRILWSDQAELIGRTFPGNRNFARALTGKVTKALGPPTEAEHVYERARAYVSEVYVPLTFAGHPRVVGVVEVYKDITRVVQEIHRTQRRIWVITGVMGLFLYVALGLVVWSASAGERRAIHRLEQQNQELTLLHGFTRSLLHPLDLGEVADTVVKNAGARLGLRWAALYRVDAGTGRTLLAAWPAPAAVTQAPPGVGVEAVEARRRVIRGTDIAIPILTEKGRHVFVGEFGDGAAADDPDVVRTLEIMLDEAAIALVNVELFTEIREAHERLAAILSGIADRMVIVDREMRIVWMNPVGVEAFGGRRAAIGAPCFEALGMEPGECQGCPAVRTFASGVVERGVRAVRTPDGRVTYLDLVTAPLRDAAGEVVQVLEVARDITELMEMETRLKETNQALLDTQAQLVEKERLAAVGEVVVGLHHAILNPLTGILGALQVLKDQGLVAPERARAITDAEAEVRKIERLIKRLPDIRRTGGTTYVGTTTMLDLDQSCADEGTPSSGG